MGKREQTSSFRCNSFVIVTCVLFLWGFAAIQFINSPYHNPAQQNAYSPPGPRAAVTSLSSVNTAAHATNEKSRALNSPPAFADDGIGFGFVVTDVSGGDHAHLMEWLQNAFVSAPAIPVEIWTKEGMHFSTNVQKYINSRKKLAPTAVVVRHFEEPLPDFSMLKLIALQNSAFKFPIYRDLDSWLCKGAVSILFDIVKAFPNVDVIWSFAPVPYGSTFNKPDKFLKIPLKDQSKYKTFPERTAGTVFAVRQSERTKMWLNDAIDIYREQSKAGMITNYEGREQASLRESFFLWREDLQEHIIGSDSACRNDPRGSTCGCLCDCSTCAFVHSQKHFDGCVNINAPEGEALDHDSMITKRSVTRTETVTELVKTVFSDRLRFAFFAGLEGTGHHAMEKVFSKCPEFQKKRRNDVPFECVHDDAFTDYLYRGFGATGGVFNPKDIKQMVRLEDSLRHAFEDAKVKYGDESTGENNRGTSGIIVLLNLHQTHQGSGFMSYPNYGGTEKPIHHPHIQLLARIAEEAKVDLRIHVLERSARDIYLSNVVHRNIWGDPMKETLALVDNAMALHGQLELIDQGFFECLTVLGMTQDHFATMGHFLIPNFPEAVTLNPSQLAMFKQIRPMGKSKYAFPYTPRETQEVTEWLTSAVSLIDASCARSRLWST